MEGRKNSSRFIPKELIEENAEDLYENAPCGYISFLPDGTIVKINQTLLKWIGYQREEILFEKKFQDLISIGGKIFYETHHAPLMQMQGFISEINYDIIRKDRTSFPALVNCVQMKDEEGNPLLNRITVFNITDRKKYEVALLHAKTKAEQAAKAKAEFLSTISHEIRTPMNAIIGVANLLLQEDLQPRQLEYLNILKNSSENLLSLINDILDFSKIESGKVTLEVKEFNIKEVIHSILYSLSVKAEEKELSVKVNIDRQLPDRVIGDPVKIGQILTNLVGNAIKFTATGSVTIDLKVQEKTEDAMWVLFSVTDTGIGIPPDKLEHIFEEFTQVSYDINLKYGGTGLGLSISQKLLELHSSKMSVESVLGKGSRFYFTLKLQLSREKEAIPSASSTSITEPSQSLEGVKLLLVEDNQINVFIVSQYLKSWKTEFDVAENGMVAVEKIIQENYDLVLMDLQMPELNGYDASRKIRELEAEKYQKLPIIALSASAKIDVKEKMEAAGINDFISKPFNPNELFNKIFAYSKDRSVNLIESIPSLSARVEDQPLAYQQSSIISLDQYIKLTKNNQEALKKLIAISIEGFLNFKNEFKRALENRDKVAVEQLAHKIKVTVNLLEAKELEFLIKQSKTLLEETNIDNENIRMLNEKLEDELTKVIRELQKSSQ